MKLLTFNCANYDDHPNWDQRVEMIVDQINRLQPDICCLQEIRFDPSQPSTQCNYLNMGEQITAQLNNLQPDTTIYHHYFQIAQYYEPGIYTPTPYLTNIYEGQSIITKNTVPIEVSFIPLPMKGSDKNRRITQHFCLKSKDYEYNIFNVHFALEDQDLIANIKTTLKYCECFKNRIILGDFNAVPNQISKYFIKAGYIDAWKFLNPNNKGLTFPSDDPKERIDYCWVEKHLAQNLKSIELIFGEANRERIYASDHLGLLVEI